MPYRDTSKIFLWAASFLAILLLVSCRRIPMTRSPSASNAAYNTDNVHGKYNAHHARTFSDADNAASRITLATRSKPKLILPSIDQFRNEPIIRIMLADGLKKVKLSSVHTFIIHTNNTAKAKPHRFISPITISHDKRGFIIRDGRKRTVAWPLQQLVIEAERRSPIVFQGLKYPYQIVLHPQFNRQQASSHDRLLVVNHVPLENYLPGVLSKELYASWHTTAYLAQAVAARSYALAMMYQKKQAYFDVRATTASQAYLGVTNHNKALNATKQTRGQVLTWQNKIIPCYYSSCDGGRGQDASIAFLDGPHILPLQGRRHGNFCKKSPYFNWPTLIRNRQSLSKRMAHWGKRHKHRIGQLGVITRIQVTKTNQAKRPAEFSITDQRGQHFTLPAELFRFACNQSTPVLPKLSAANLLRSSFVWPTVRNRQIVFQNGHGFGHGVGLCQWGMQHLAQRGQAYQQILSYYYPSSVLQKIYR